MTRKMKCGAGGGRCSAGANPSFPLMSVSALLAKETVVSCVTEHPERGCQVGSPCAACSCLEECLTQLETQLKVLA